MLILRAVGGLGLLLHTPPTTRPSLTRLRMAQAHAQIPCASHSFATLCPCPTMRSSSFFHSFHSPLQSRIQLLHRH